MSRETLTAALQYLGSRPGGESTSVQWFGGEPSLVPIATYQHAWEVCASMPKHEWRFVTQTNGQCLSRDTVCWWRDHGVGVGVSCDGPGALTDDYRGRGAFARIERSVALCIDEGLSVGLLTVIHRHNVGHIDEILDMAEGWGVPVVFSPLQRIGRARADQNTGLALLPGTYSAAMQRVFTRWSSVGHPTDYAAAHQWIYALVSGLPGVCAHLPDCQVGFGAIDCDGSVYTCAKMYDQPEQRMGHVSDGWDTCRASAARTRFRRPLPSGCRQCRFSDVCSGGCPASRELGCGDTVHVWTQAAAALTGVDHD